MMVKLVWNGAHHEVRGYVFGPLALVREPGNPRRRLIVAMDSGRVIARTTSEKCGRRAIKSMMGAYIYDPESVPGVLAYLRDKGVIHAR